MAYNKKKIYDETASLIVDLCVRGRLNSEEMHFLLNLLDMSVLQRDNSGLFAILKVWLKGENDEEIDAIVKATLLAIDFSNQKSLQTNTELIKGLIAEKYTT
ncbi:MAG: hypothetical protein PHT79_06545 [Syntrophomonadaceae bacterium]|nr:hypothetical protein [Syntrophomonadaceae bacterium]MDD3889052.1 hypothetical protein [Syntrophomonadaceae bacterium]MDD4549402.1 hypothetical protein [Syntrophomonadaceae bacterium]